ncbi:hypothetical protein H920_08800 [Fukomys damarensis]|uniref:Uncharacterized protein n=1 Tax=Fukomys damarensis TaxID=885580 RepID=A0A091DH56_FUKDA|nr:hypothetical protein H920_08800 [Fukomys damarensis]
MGQSRAPEQTRHITPIGEEEASGKLCFRAEDNSIYTVCNLLPTTQVSEPSTCPMGKESLGDANTNIKIKNMDSDTKTTKVAHDVDISQVKEVSPDPSAVVYGASNRESNRASSYCNSSYQLNEGSRLPLRTPASFLFLVRSKQTSEDMVHSTW